MRPVGAVRAGGRWTLILWLGLVGFSGRVIGQELYTFNLTLLGGLGGAQDSKPSSFTNRSYQAGLSLVTEPGTLVGVRIGRLDLSRHGAPFGDLLGARLEYVNIAGEYRFHEGYYQSGLFLGLGSYRLTGTGVAGRERQDSIGGVLGVNADFDLTRRLALRLEVSGHYARFRQAELFAIAHAGVAVHF